MNVTVPFAFGALPARHATDATADEDIRRRTRQALVPLSVAAAAVCGWALAASLFGAIPDRGPLEADSGSRSFPELQSAALAEQFVAPAGLKFADSTARPLTFETSLVRQGLGELN